MDKRLSLQYFNNKDLQNPFSELNINYLNKIIELCKVNGIKITALNTPLNDYFYNKIPDTHKAKLKEILATNQLEYLDLSNLKLSNDHFIPDGDHVSFEGAQVVSNEFRKLN